MNRRKPPTFSVHNKYKHTPRKSNVTSRRKFERLFKNLSDCNNNETIDNSDNSYELSNNCDSGADQTNTSCESTASTKQSPIINQTNSNIEILNYTFKIEPKEIFQISLVRSGAKFRWKVLKGWSTKLNAAVWKASKLDCSWSFKRADVILDRQNDTREVIVPGRCTFSKCSAILSVSTRNNIGIVNLDIFNHDKSIPHLNARKRFITGTEKTALAKRLKTSSAYAIQNEMKNKLMEDTDLEPCHLPNLGKTIYSQFIQKYNSCMCFIVIRNTSKHQVY